MFTHIQTLYLHLKHNPRTGIISGLSSGLFIKVQHLLTDDLVLKVVAGLGTWCSSALAILTLVIWLIKQVEFFKRKRNKTTNNEKVSV